MKRKIWLFAAMVSALPGIVAAQSPPAPPYYAMDPHAPMTPSANSPVQQQIIENYRTQLLQSQRGLAQQNPAGTSPAQLDVNHQLNQYNSAPPLSSSSPAANPLPVNPPAATPGWAR